MKVVYQCIFCDRARQMMPIDTCENCGYRSEYLDCTYVESDICNICNGDFGINSRHYMKPDVICDKCKISLAETVQNDIDFCIY